MTLEMMGCCRDSPKRMSSKTGYESFGALFRPNISFSSFRIISFVSFRFVNPILLIWKQEISESSSMVLNVRFLSIYRCMVSFSCLLFSTLRVYTTLSVLRGASCFESTSSSSSSVLLIMIDPFPRFSSGISK